MSDLIRRVFERKIVQWALAYGAGAWLVLEVVHTLAEIWLWPPLARRCDWIPAAAIPTMRWRVCGFPSSGTSRQPNVSFVALSSCSTTLMPCSATAGC